MNNKKNQNEISLITSNPGKPIYGAIMCLFFTAVFVSFGLILLFSEIIVTGFGGSLLFNKIMGCVVMLVIASLPFISGLYYLRKIKDYRAAMKELEQE